ncbi:hypothetical protein MG290_01910 [Flavobacterium sp. CBA20B-1]|uniref:hypothetical protein n=1 Tax=unclassified Flavobacterium TaxID=196869 RepID=UPI002224DAAB|nr:MULTISPECIES: hypothetical protein [unclassified Flavobacterium]WCM42451.1 hypothetical protein MG290_01910 [Flavobacterium sp. CBA20B-1]
MKNEFVRLINAFLYRDDIPKADVLEKINSLIESTFLVDDLVLAQNVMNTYRIDINNFCTNPTSQELVKIIPCFTAILSLLNLQE